MQGIQTRPEPTAIAPRLLYDLQSAADLLSISLRKIYHLIERGEISTVRIDKRVLIAWEELRRFVESRQAIA
jgi:excisionase family DNA binding protein